jgi:leucyl aminopeptidase (aminopeptidase T)
METPLDKAINNIFKLNLGIRKKEKVLIFSDNYDKKIGKIGKSFAEYGEKFTEKIEYIECKPTGCHGIEPPEEIWNKAFGINAINGIKEQKLFQPLITKKIIAKQIHKVEKIIGKYKEDSVDVVVALPYFSTSHTKFRDMLNNICGTRYASMPLFDEAMLSGAMMVNWKRMKKRTEDIVRIINKYETIEIETPNGSYISFSKKNRNALADTGIITKPGAFSNLPAGEAFLAPLEGTAQGRLVLEWAPKRKLKQPVTLHIEKGEVREVEGNEKYVKFLAEILSEKKENRNIAELGIGTNDKASRPDNILESEKIFGTIHIALGDNSSFGGTVRTSFHQDFVFFKPLLSLISKNGKKKTLMKNGRLQEIIEN